MSEMCCTRLASWQRYCTAL